MTFFLKLSFKKFGYMLFRDVQYIGLRFSHNPLLVEWLSVWAFGLRLLVQIRCAAPSVLANCLLLVGPGVG